MNLRDAVFLAWIAVASAALLTWGIFYVLHRWGSGNE